MKTFQILLLFIISVLSIKINKKSTKSLITMNENQKNEIETLLTPYNPYINDNKEHSNINKQTEEETSISKLKYSPGLEDFFEDIAYIDINSKYYTTYGGFIFNNGQDQKVILIGDSIVEFAIYRAHFLKNKYGSSNFPTVILKQWYGNAIALPCRHTDTTISDYEANYELIKKVKPYSVFISGLLDVYINQEESEEDELHDEINCCGVKYQCKNQSKKDIDKLFNIFTKNIKEITELGIKVYVATLKPIGSEFNPVNMYNDQGVIAENIRPIRLSDFLKKSLFLYNRLNKAILDAGAQIIDYTKNLCKEDLCNVLDYRGYPINKEESHPNNYVIREYFDVLDEVFGK